MGPKKGKGKGKKAETDEEREARLAEEARVAEAERKRIAEEAEKKRLEEERIAAENKAKRVAEMEWLNAELARCTAAKEVREARKVEEYKNIAAAEEWAKHKDPSDDYDMKSERDINTFMSQVEDNATATDMTGLMALSNQVCGLVTALDNIWAASVATADSAQMDTCVAFKRGFNDLIKTKIDIVTGELLRTADESVNDRMEYHIEKSSGPGGVSFAMWTSLNDIRPIRKAIHFESLGVQIDVPKQILAQDSKFAHRLLRIPIDVNAADAYAKEGGEFKTGPGVDKITLGDLYVLDILFSPPQPFELSAKKWVMRDRSATSNDLKYSPYPSNVPCKFYVTVPDSIIMSDDVVFAHLDPDTNQWSQEALSEYTYDPEKKQVVFLSTKLGVYSFIKSRIVNFPYKSWSLTPMRMGGDKSSYEKHARLSVNVGSLNIAIDVVGSSVQLVNPAAWKDEMANQTTPGGLLLALQRRGVNLLPCEQDPLRTPGVKQPIKDADLEQVVMEEMALCASSMDFGSTAWNGLDQMGPSRIGLFVRETSAYTGGDDVYDYENVLVEKDVVSETHIKCSDEPMLPGAGARFTLVKGNDYGNVEDFSHEARPGEKVRVSVLDAMSTRLTDEAKERVIRTNGGFEDTVLTLLRLVRPLVLG